MHHHLVRAGTALRAGLVVESGEPREVHHIAALIGYGASAVNPYLMLESVAEMLGRADRGRPTPRARLRIAAIGKGLLKMLSKMGISTIRSYRGAQIFEAVGLDDELVERHFTGTPSGIGGIGLERSPSEALDRHARAYPEAHGGRCPRTSRTRCCPRPTRSCCPRAARTSGAATASGTCGTRPRSRGSSTRFAATAATRAYERLQPRS